MSNKLIARTEKAIERLKSQEDVVVVESAYTKYRLVEKCSKELGWVFRKSPVENIKNGYTLFWIDGSPLPERVMKLKLYQKINHFPVGTLFLCRKHQMVFHIRQMEKLFPNEFRIIPKSYVLPTDTKEFIEECKVDGTYYIKKPYDDAQGNGIELFSLRDEPEESEGEGEDDDEEEEEEEETIPKGGQKTKKEFEKSIQNEGETIIQEYIPNPLLLNKKKFDLRIYVLVKSLRPSLKLFVYNEGLVRICTEDYEKPTLENEKNLFTHLTNYSINKKKFESRAQLKKEGSIIKQSFSHLNEYLVNEFGDEKGKEIVKNMWNDIYDVIIKSFISVYNKMLVNYEKCLIGEEKKYDNYGCFEIVGIDILIDDKFKPWLLEGNVSPSFWTDTKVDYDCKYGVISETFRLLGIDPKKRKECLIREKEKFLERIMSKRPKKESKDVFNQRMRKWCEEEEVRHNKVEMEEIKNFVKVFPCEDDGKYQKYIKELMKKKKGGKRRRKKVGKRK